jgi:hypothetical protein
VPRRHISSRYFEIADEQFDLDLNKLDIEEHETGESSFLNSFTHGAFDNTKRFNIGPQRAAIKFDPTDPSVHQLNLTATISTPSDEKTPVSGGSRKSDRKWRQ